MKNLNVTLCLHLDFFFFFFFFGQVTKTVQIDFYNSAKCIFVFVSLQLIFFFYKDLKPFTVILESKELMKQMSSYIYIYLYICMWCLHPCKTGLNTILIHFD